MESDILNNKLKTFLTEVCGFSKDQKWKLVYKGSIDGFCPTDFHSKCDSIEKTITIIESHKNHIFGGYTDKAWSSVEGYVNDSNALLFNLVNSSYQPLKIKCSDPEHAIFNIANSGPIFGKGSKGKADLCIKLHSKTILLSFSNLGGSYKVPGLDSTKSQEAILLRSYLAGSEQFTIKNIEVYCKI